MLEVEVKYAVTEFAPIEAVLARWGAIWSPTQREADHYFNAPDRDFARTDEAFRVRSVGPSNCVTYKGPKIDKATKARLEIEVALADGEEVAADFRQVLTQLGYRFVAVVRKTRRTAHFERAGFAMQACLDEVESVGRYAELEVVAEEKHFETAKAAVLSVAAELGLNTQERRSYLQMLLGEGQTTRPLQLTHTVSDTRRAVSAARARGRTVGFVATMGALHEGHASLIRLARQECGFVVVSIFVNPTQFGPNEDLARYPRTLQEDQILCQNAGADLIFAPEPAEIYPSNFRSVVEVQALGDHLCGSSRPGHFRGVATVVLKLLNIVQPDRAYFGQKDAQQARIIRQMVRDLDVPAEIVIGPTVREPDGLALSSRNRYLAPADRRAATVLYESLSEVRRRVESGERDAADLRMFLAERIQVTPGARLDYAEIVDAETLLPVARLTCPALAAVAVKFGSTRLIDNMVLPVPEAE